MHTMKKLSFYFLTLILIVSGFSCSLKKESLRITGEKTEYYENPVDIGTSVPRFSWQLEDTMRNVQQEAYRILVAEYSRNLKPGKAEVWDTDWIESSESLFIPFEGKPLKSGRRYYWKVLVRDNNKREVVSEELNFFETALLQSDEWKANWISFDGGREENSFRPRSVMLRKDFNLKNSIEKARVYVSGLGNYVLYLNGEKIGNDLLTPGWTDYHKRVQYQVYDITDYVTEGNNAAGILLGNMWWSGGLGWRGAEVYSDGPLKAIAQIEVEYKDGSKDLILSDPTWKAAQSPVTENSLYHGETYDARLEMDGWSKPGFDDSGWNPAETEDMSNIKLSTRISPPIQIMDTITPESVKEVKPGVFVYDMGFNMVGIARLSVSGEAGDTVVMKFAELLHEDGTVAQENLRSARATDRYILKGDGTESWAPHFTYHGFRYVQIEGFPGEPKKGNLTGLRFYSSASESGQFASSNDLLNNIWANIMNGQKGNMHSVPTDCPQRDERLGWMGDAQIFAPTSAYNMDMAAFYAKWLRDITDSQHETGYVFDVNPAIVVSGPSKAGWGDAVTVVPMVMYDFYKDKRILEENYEGMKAWVEYMRQKSIDHIYRWSENEGEWEGYGDWIAVVKSPVQPISAAYYYYSTKLLSKAAGILENTNDQQFYSALSDSIRQAFHKRFFDSELLNYPSGTQTANLLPLNFSLTPEEHKDKVAKNIIDDVRERGNHPSTGFLGTAYLLPTLSRFGEHQLAYETAINEDYPSWGYMVKNGATSMWELWNSDTEPPDRMNSRNHFALGSVGEWYYSHLAGIRPLEPGFRKIKISPLPADGLDWVQSTYHSACGPVKSSWSKDGEAFHMDIEIPANTMAEVVIPILSPNRQVLTESGNVVTGNEETTDVKGISVKEINDNSIVLEIKSGKYAFTLK